ncbi:hypothetical protein TCON_1873 [Astathelohania contejeani]|uniref:Uncharacterized protein n=1 Tax=Astathelohania contejeani TaxID=164912 RepID=A0ABQ7HXK9_9MICR|nr:hypothetical protein TCON_1873 [Thelohania contejeani]
MSFFCCDIKEVVNMIKELGDKKKIHEMLLRTYLMNLLLYMQLSEEDKNDHPIRDTLMELSELIRKITDLRYSRTYSLEDEASEDNTRRALTTEMLKNKGRNKKKKLVYENPRIKNRKKSDDIKKKAVKEVEKNINTKLSKTSRFN